MAALEQRSATTRFAERFRNFGARSLRSLGGRDASHSSGDFRYSHVGGASNQCRTPLSMRFQEADVGYGGASPL